MLKKKADIGDLLSAEHIKQQEVNQSYLLKIFTSMTTTNEEKLGVH